MFAVLLFLSRGKTNASTAIWFVHKWAVPLSWSWPLHETIFSSMSRLWNMIFETMGCCSLLLIFNQPHDIETPHRLQIVPAWQKITQDAHKATSHVLSTPPQMAGEVWWILQENRLWVRTCQDLLRLVNTIIAAIAGDGDWSPNNYSTIGFYPPQITIKASTIMVHLKKNGTFCCSVSVVLLVTSVLTSFEQNVFLWCLLGWSLIRFGGCATTFYTLHSSTLHTPHFTRYSPHSTLYTSRMTLCNSTLCTPHPPFYKDRANNKTRDWKHTAS